MGIMENRRGYIGGEENLAENAVTLYTKILSAVEAHIGVLNANNSKAITTSFTDLSPNKTRSGESKYAQKKLLK